MLTSDLDNDRDLDLVVVRQGNQNRQMRGEPPFASTLIQKIVASIR